MKAVLSLILLLAISVFNETGFAEKTVSASAEAASGSVFGTQRPSLIFYVPGVQMRYQDTAQQTRELQNHFFYSMGYRSSNQIGVSLEFGQQQEANGNSSFQVGRVYRELTLSGQAPFVRFRFNQILDHPVDLGVGAKVVIGYGESLVRTSLLGDSRDDQSKQNSILGLGGFLSFSLHSFVFETDFRYQTSMNYEPNNIWMGSLKLGYAIDL